MIEVDTIQIATKNGLVTVPYEPIDDWLCITPTIQSEGSRVRLGDFTLTHRATGRALSQPGCAECCREAGHAVSKLGLDWSGVTADTSKAWVQRLAEDQAIRADDGACDPLQRHPSMGR